MKFPLSIGKELLCSMDNNSAKLLGLKDVIVKNVESNEKELHINIELPCRKHKCPVCKAKTCRIHDYRNQVIRDSKAFGKNVYLHLRKRRYVCTDCGKRFYEENSFLPRYYSRDIIMSHNGLLLVLSRPFGRQSPPHISQGRITYL